MNKPKNYEKGGPKYMDQMYDAYCNVIEHDTDYPKAYTWDTCMNQCEKVYDERIRNIITPLYNLVEALENGNKELLTTPALETYKNCLNRLLNIPEE